MGSMIKKALFRLSRILTGNKGVYCKKGKRNKICKGNILYESAKIGHDNYFAPYSLVNNAVIGNFCSIGPGCKIGLGNHDLNSISTCPKINNGSEYMKLFDLDNPTVIENDVWLGANVVVKQGVKISNGAVVGANSVVTKDVEPYSVVAGCPAHEIRKRFSNEKIKELSDSGWFLKPEKEAKKTVCDLYNKFKDEE